MSSAGKWVLGLLLLVVGAVFVAQAVSSDPESKARVELPSAESAGSSKATDEAAAAADAAKKVAGTVAGDVACKKTCIEVNEVSNDAITTSKLAAGSVTLSKLAFEVPNLNELENEINARKAAEAATKAAQSEALAQGAKNDAAITAASSNGITAEAAARTAADDKIGKDFAAADAGLLSSLNGEVANRGVADDVLQGKLNTEIADRAAALTNLRSELASSVQVGSPIVQINNNEIVANAVTTDKILNRTIKAEDLGVDSVIGHAPGAINTNVKLQTLRGQKIDNGAGGIADGDIFKGTITGEKTPTLTAANGNLALGTVTGQADNNLVPAVETGNLAFNTVGRKNLADKAVDTAQLEDLAVTNAKLGPDAVTTAKIANGTIKGEDVTIIDADALTGANIKNDSIAAIDLADDAVIGRAAGETLTNTKARSIRGERIDNVGAALGAGDLAIGTITGEIAPTAAAANGNLALGTIGTANIADGQVTFPKLGLLVQGRITTLESGLAQEILDRAAADGVLNTALNNEITTRQAADTTISTNLATEATTRAADDTTNANAIAAEALTRGNFDSSLGTEGVVASAAALVGGGKLPNTTDGLVEWSRLKGVPTGFADNIDNDGSAAATTAVNGLKSDLAAVDAGGANNGNGLVDFSTLENVAVNDSMITDVDAAKISGGIVGSQITDGTITAADLAGEDDPNPLLPSITPGAVTGEKILDGTIQARDLADGAVTSAKIADGTIESGDLKDGAVTTTKLTSNLASVLGIGGTLTVATSNADVVSTALTIPETIAAHKVLLTGQVQVNCTTCDGTEILSYQVLRTGGTAGDGAMLPLYNATVAPAGMAVLPISLVDTVTQAAAATPLQYVVRVTLTTATGTDSASVVSAVLNAVDLGR